MSIKSQAAIEISMSNVNERNIYFNKTHVLYYKSEKYIYHPE